MHGSNDGVRHGSWLCENAAARVRPDLSERIIIVSAGSLRFLVMCASGSILETLMSSGSWNRGARSSPHARIAASSGLMPMMFITRVRL
jgi:hypothetical protein